MLGALLMVILLCPLVCVAAMPVTIVDQSNVSSTTSTTTTPHNVTKIFFKTISDNNDLNKNISSELNNNYDNVTILMEHNIDWQPTPINSIKPYIFRRRRKQFKLNSSSLHYMYDDSELKKLKNLSALTLNDEFNRNIINMNSIKYINNSIRPINSIKNLDTGNKLLSNENNSEHENKSLVLKQVLNDATSQSENLNNTINHLMIHHMVALSRTERSINPSLSSFLEHENPSNIERVERSTKINHLSGSVATRKIQLVLKNHYLQILPDGTVNGTVDHESDYSK